LTLRLHHRKDEAQRVIGEGRTRVAERGISRVRRFSNLAILSLVGFSSACAALPGGGPAPLDTYELTAPGERADKRAGGVQVLIAEASALKALDGQNIVIRPADGSIQYLKGAQWSDRLPEVVQARLADAFQKSGAFGGVGKPGEGLAIDYQIITEIRRVEVDVAAGGRAHVELFVRVLNDRNGVVRASKVFTADAALSGSGNQAYVAALDSAFNAAAADIVRWADSLI
jgi:cholesterol transport system auxiliary component